LTRFTDEQSCAATHIVGINLLLLLIDILSIILLLKSRSLCMASKIQTSLQYR